MNYWETVLNEVMNKHNDSTQFVFTNLKEQQANDAKLLKREDRRMGSQRITNNYYLGDEYPDVYFTQRETECMVLLLRGMTITAVAEELGLSPRTVEFYVKNMKMKIGCSSKSELVEKVARSKFLQQLNK